MSSSTASAVPTVGLDIGGTKVLGVLLDAHGEVLKQQRRLSPHAGVDALVATATAIIDDLAEPDSPVGVGAAGLVSHAGEILYSPNLPTVRHAQLHDALAAVTHHPLVVDNDANVATRGEVAYGAARGHRDVLLVTLGTGIGGGILLNGELYRGAHGFGAEIGHITVERGGPLCACGEHGHWEAIASGSALGRMARELVEHGSGARILAAAGGVVDAITGVHVAAAAREHDPDAIGLLAAYADNVALGLAGLANVLDPELIVIAGGLVELGPLLFAPLDDAFVRHIEGGRDRPKIPIVPAELGERAGAVGAAVLARELLA
jgi:glucokinase